MGLPGRLSRDVKFEAFFAPAVVLEALRVPHWWFRRQGSALPADTIALDGELADIKAPLRFAVLPNALCTIVPEVT